MPDPEGNPFPARGRDEFEAWFHAPVACESPDPRIEVRRARPSEFDRIYDLVDEAFGSRRSRALSDWLYRRNPYGVARCWLSADVATGKLIGAAVNWPWPLARGTRPLPAAQGGDAAVARGWQRQHIHRHAGNIRESHPWIRSIINYGWPNPGSVERIRKADRSSRLIGTLARRVLPLRTRALLADRGFPEPLPSVGGRMLDTTFGIWSSLVLGRPFDAVVERVRRFDDEFDQVTRRCMPWEGYWSPHDAEFLNWRYFSDPDREHAAFALIVGERLTGYGVVRIDRAEARLMELVVPADQKHAARALLFRLIKTAAEAGCTHLGVIAPPAWPHWRLLRLGGFVRVKSKAQMYAYSWREDTPGVDTLDNWRFLGGDLDPFV